MKSAQRLTIAATVFAALSFAIATQAQTDPAPAADPVLKAIPEDALGFVLVKNLAQTDKAISKLAAMVQAPAPSVLSMFKLQAGIQEGLDENGSAAIAVLPATPLAGTSPPNQLPAPLPVAFFPVSDYKKFIAQFQPNDAAAETTGVTIAGHALIAGHKGSFAVFMLPDNKEQLAKLLASTKGVDSLVGSVEPWIGRHQISVVATPAGSKIFFQLGAAQLKNLRGVLSQLQNPRQSTQITAAFEMYESFLTKASEEVGVFAIALHLDDSSNVSIDSHTSFIPGGDWAAATKELKPWEGDRFAGLHSTQFMFAGQTVVPAGWIDGLAKFSAKWAGQMTKGENDQGLSEEKRKGYAEAMRSAMTGMQSVSFVMAKPKRGGSLYDGITEIMKVDDAPTFFARYQTAMEKISEISKGRKNFPLKFSEVKKIEIDGHAGLSITVDLSAMFAQTNNPEAAKLMPALFGPNGTMTIKVVEADERTVVIAIGDDEHAKDALAAATNPKSNLASDPEVAATLKLLPPHAQVVGLLSIKGYMDFVGTMMAAIAPGAPINIKMPEVPAMAPLGFAAEAGGIGLDTQLVVPAETIVALGKFVFRQSAGKTRTKIIEIKPAP